MSQWQIQLLCIIRVLLVLPSLLILDEATSSIDTRTEQKIQNAFAKMMAGRTSFIVAHRLSTIQNADVILVMRDGHIIEQGNHETLLKQNGFYAKLYNSQFASQVKFVLYTSIKFYIIGTVPHRKLWWLRSDIFLQ